MEDLNKLAVENFREYLRIPSVHPNVDYDPCVKFIQKQAESIGLQFRVHYCFPRKPIVILTWVGKESNLSSILLNGHMDVVPVFADKWTHPPFAAEMDEKGNIYGRGAQDMKSSSIAHLEAIRRLKFKNVSLKRTVHITFVPDEEIGGAEGMEAFVKTEEFKKLNIGFSLDEGMLSSKDTYIVHHGERTRWVLRIHCPGQPGHGSLLLENTAGEKLRKILDRIYEFRENEKRILRENPNLQTGDVTSFNLTKVEGGVQSNVIPTEFVLTIDCRISTSVNIMEFEELLNTWCKEAGEGVWIEYEQKDSHVAPTRLDESNLFWVAFKNVFDDMNVKVKQEILFGITDNRFIRASGIPALGFGPFIDTTLLVHDHNEYLNKDALLWAIEVYQKVLIGVANV